MSVRVSSCPKKMRIHASSSLMATKPPNASTTPSTSAFLSSLYIYNPSLGRTDNTVHEQLIFHYAPQTSDQNAETNALDKQLRAIGLAQGIVEFARAFSPNAPVQEVRTQKGFAVPLEVERGWWILATIEVPSPAPADLITPSILCLLLRRAYRLQKIQLRSFKYLLRAHSLEHLKSTIAPYYNSFAEQINLSQNGVETDFGAVRWSCQPLESQTRDSLLSWLRRTKKKTRELIDVLVFRAPKQNLPYEAQTEGLVFPGLQNSNVSPQNIHDIALLLSTLEFHDLNKAVDINGETSKRPVNLPVLSQSWDSVVQTSSSLFSALSFGTLPAKRSPLSMEISKEEPRLEMKSRDEGEWIIGGDKECKRVWLEADGERPVPISLGNQRPGFLGDLPGQQTPGEEDLIEVEVSVYKFNDLLITFLMYPSTNPPESFKEIFKDLTQPPLLPRPPTPQSLKPFILLHDPLNQRIYSTIPPIPPPQTLPQQSFSLTPKRTVKRDPWLRDHALELSAHILRLREHYSHHPRVREYTAKSSNFFIFRTLVPSDERSVKEFAEGWYVVKLGAQGGAGGLGRGDDAGGLEDVARQGREKCREVWREMSVLHTLESDEE